MKKVYIIGGGPAGMMAAISAKTHHPTYEVTILERNEQLGKKLMLTGGGRCNVTADVGHDELIANIVKNGKFLFSSLQEFDATSIQSFFVSMDCPLKVEDHHRVFPKSDKAEDIRKALTRKLKALHVKIVFQSKVLDVDYKQQILYTEQEDYHYDHIILATGGKTYHTTGSDGSGYALAKKAGHTISDLLPAEVPLVSNDEVIQKKILQGLSLSDVTLSVLQNGKIKKRIHHDLIFTHFGISGPAALRASTYVLKGLEKEDKVMLEIDFLPTLHHNDISEQLRKEEAIALPKRLLQYLKSISKDEMALVHNIKKFPMSVYTTRGFANAFVTNGGISIKEIYPKTMGSKIIDTLSFCGEVMDINAFTGGYNITVAFVSGYVAGKYIE
ncbi:putative Rossmann fold flavoprotein [Breznakia sp. PF5-3]|uniref:aminoacetone oxidase family FAD-binding enzyme n=1 Tax=unclassified Breznakia TaxID=2623764 RepID=UPI0024053ACA|nr:MULTISPECIES: aminoacetone oxidase family FAD-binding enzyme [unclassified Breznakia]MDF9824090.1 putative Rossmann fold flavoprotein [Breznakia sp. PM6-1]MDF9834844.1 putative Rossmann fold flavoprotein [Breznakia sp. PF5-3]MDF9837134.1 putative Rossmann fold flavoprotein [Breznakia sp. PFB2-8]MDF9859059.1 putative Rossmann fold flavoprotein [Breznakia sp. PH5-24]